MNSKHSSFAAEPTYVRDGCDTADHSAADRRYLTSLGISVYTDTGRHWPAIPGERLLSDVRASRPDGPPLDELHAWWGVHA